MEGEERQDQGESETKGPVLKGCAAALYGKV